MPLLLHIDTATEHGSVCISDNLELVGLEKSLNQKDHASVLQPTIQKLLTEHHLRLRDLDGIAVTAGPGSYTGLRVGLASAKGLCYALHKPLILLNTLEVMANASLSVHPQEHGQSSTLFCPMIDARRMEVFTALYRHNLEPALQPTAILLQDNSFHQYLDAYKVIFSGSGSKKCRNIVRHPNALYSEALHSAADMIPLGVKSFSHKQFADIAYSEPFYLKEFFSPAGVIIDKKF